MPPDTIFILLAVVALIAIGAIMINRLRHIPAEQICVKCGYSRVGIDENQPCPECGSSGPWGRITTRRSRAGRTRKMIVFTAIVLMIAWFIKSVASSRLPDLWEYQLEASLSEDLPATIDDIAIVGRSKRWRDPNDLLNGAESFPVPDDLDIRVITKDGSESSCRIIKWGAEPNSLVIDGEREPYFKAKLTAWLSQLASEDSDEIAAVVESIDLLARAAWDSEEVAVATIATRPASIAPIAVQGYTGTDLTAPWFKWGGWATFLLVLAVGNWLIWRRRGPRALATEG